MSVTCLALALWLAAEPTTPATTAAQLEALQRELDAQRARQDALEESARQLQRKLDDATALAQSVELRLNEKERLKVDLGGYLDLGFFIAQGNGSGVRRDLERHSHRYDDILSSWVLIGDPLSTMVNARGDAADLTDSRAFRFDGIHSQGRPTFLVNTVNLSLRASVDDAWFVTVLVDLLPRERIFSGEGAVGDFIDVKLASLRWVGRFTWGALTVNAGKFDSLFGLEYRTQEANQRLTVTPSLLCRYTCGRPLGLKARVDLFDGHLELGVAVTNGTGHIETFEFSNEIDFNFFKTVSGRVAVRLPVLDGLELNVSGAVGAQDRQRDDSVLQWHVGGAARLEWSRLQLQAEYIIGRANGKPGPDVACGAAPCLQYKAAYGLLGVRVAYFFVPYARVDWRQADMRSGFDYAYQADTMRVTAGLRVEPNSRLAVKAEYTFNHEFTGFQFPNDVFTTSFVIGY